jgi:hypothetical protein
MLDETDMQRNERSVADMQHPPDLFWLSNYA